ncbi:hypothetical protein CA85_04620 [Allorhodopirellula solitaria]|uniref:Uncharacterized protein n=1 Tax=Allorhodopirellula solitaria TaxID=2527987 RepID=A0A5C5YJV1_9BACT|nr:hypothetical protein CA85_04620 [Allorhodopirellula solitaria]
MEGGETRHFSKVTIVGRTYSIAESEDPVGLQRAAPNFTPSSASSPSTFLLGYLDCLGA